jgi:hypothetical protein
VTVARQHFIGFHRPFAARRIIGQFQRLLVETVSTEIHSKRSSRDEKPGGKESAIGTIKCRKDKTLWHTA